VGADGCFPLRAAVDEAAELDQALKRFDTLRLGDRGYPAYI
jgi:hypothetical protein